MYRASFLPYRKRNKCNGSISVRVYVIEVRGIKGINNIRLAI